MSKKSRKRNRKILGLLAAGLGAAALARRGTAQGVSGADKAKFTSNAAYSPAPVTGTVYPGSNRRKKWVSTNPLASPKWNKMDTSEVDMNYVAPSTKRYSNPDFGMGAWDGAKKGGRAGKDFGKRGVGKAKRGFGRALKKGK
jgi:hypothetical protein